MKRLPSNGRSSQFVTERFGGFRGLLTAEVQRAKAELAKHVSTIEMLPQKEGRKGHYIAVGEWTLLGKRKAYSDGCG